MCFVETGHHLRIHAAHKRKRPRQTLELLFRAADAAFVEPDRVNPAPQLDRLGGDPGLVENFQ